MPDQFQALITEMSTSSLPQLWVDPEGVQGQSLSGSKMRWGGALSMCLALEEPRVGKVPSGRF